MDLSRPWWREPMINRRTFVWRDSENRLRRAERWQDAIIYQISPWSFQDTTGSGTGDLEGIIDRLDYIASLEVDAIWLTPIYESPMDDFGYDVTDICTVDKSFGDLDTFDRFLQLAHERGIMVMLDGVWSHTSDRHPWFLESRKSRNNPKADWYVWADPRPDGGPPNNWRSCFNGDSGWKFVEERGQYYWFNFLASQPDLNWHKTEVREVVLKHMRFWLDRGIDGFRVDAVNFFAHDPELRDNPLRTEKDGLPDGVSPSNPMVEHLFVNSFNRPETFDYLKPLRALVDEYPGTVLMGEVTLCEDSVDMASQFTKGNDRLHLSYHSGLLFEERLTAHRLREVIRKVIDCYGEGGSCWIVGNHDYGRLRSQWGAMEHPYPDDFYRMAAALLVTLPGALCLWQGDELGLPVARIPQDIPEEDIRDPYGRFLYPKVQGRDGSRTPMPWDDRMENAGFTTGKPWLPIPKSHLERSVRLQTRDPNSLLNCWRQLIRWRRGQPALEAGIFELLDLPDPLLGMIRRYAEQAMLCVFNVSEQPVTSEIPGVEQAHPVLGLSFEADYDGHQLTLPPWGVFFANLRSPEQMAEITLGRISYVPRS